MGGDGSTCNNEVQMHIKCAIRKAKRDSSVPHKSKRVFKQKMPHCIALSVWTKAPRIKSQTPLMFAFALKLVSGVIRLSKPSLWLSP